MQALLAKHAPFTWRRKEKEPLPLRKSVKLKLHCDEDILTSEMDYIREHPEDVEWLEANLRPRFWRKLLTEVNANKPPGAPDIEE